MYNAWFFVVVWKDSWALYLKYLLSLSNVFLIHVMSFVAFWVGEVKYRQSNIWIIFWVFTVQRCGEVVPSRNCLVRFKRSLQYFVCSEWINKLVRGLNKYDLELSFYWNKLVATTYLRFLTFFCYFLLFKS